VEVSEYLPPAIDVSEGSEESDSVAAVKLLPDQIMDFQVGKNWLCYSYLTVSSLGRIAKAVVILGGSF